MPLTLIASIGGMSEYSMMTGPENWRITYPLFILAMVILAFLTFRVLKWIEKRDSAARRAHADDSDEHAKRAQRYRHGYLPKLLLGRPVRVSAGSATIAVGSCQRRKKTYPNAW